MGDYIEREVIQKRLNRIVEVNNLRTDRAWFTPYGVKALIEEIPAADVRPVVRGTWRKTGGKFSRYKTIDRRILTCSVCGNFLCMEGVNAGRGDANFCPNCGAEMRAEAE